MREYLPRACLLMLAAMLSFAQGAHAEDRYLFGDVGLIGKHSDKYELRLGAMAYDTGIFTTHDFSGTVINGEFLFPSPGFLYWLGSPRPHIGVDAAITDNAIHFGYAGLSWDTYFTDRIFTTASLGLGVTTADELEHPSGYKALGCRVLFHLGAGIGLDITEHASLQLYADHFSNANLCSPNNGAEAAGIRFGYRF